MIRARIMNRGGPKLDPRLATFPLYTLPNTTPRTSLQPSASSNPPSFGLILRQMARSYTQFLKSRAPPLFAAVHLVDESQAGGKTHVECIRRWEGTPRCGEKEVESPTWGKVVE